MAVTAENTFNFGGMLDQDPSTGFFGLGTEGGLVGTGIGATQYPQIQPGVGIGDNTQQQPAGPYDYITDPQLRGILSDIEPLFQVDTEPTRANLFDMINQQTRGMSEQLETNLNVRGLRGGGGQGLSALSGLRTAEMGAKANVLTGLGEQQQVADRDWANTLMGALQSQIGLDTSEEMMAQMQQLASEASQQQTSLDQSRLWSRVLFPESDRLEGLAQLLSGGY